MVFLDRIEINSEILVGKPIIRGTRISVELILKKVSEGISWSIIQDELGIARDDIKAALKYAEKTVASEDIFAVN